MINHTNLPRVLGPLYVEGAEYKMIECQANPTRYGLTSLTLDGPPWQDLGEFSDPEIDSHRRFRILMRLPKPKEAP